jgi:hypothetical protein
MASNPSCTAPKVNDTMRGAFFTQACLEQADQVLRSKIFFGKPKLCRNGSATLATRRDQGDRRCLLTQRFFGSHNHRFKANNAAKATQLRT